MVKEQKNSESEHPRNQASYRSFVREIFDGTILTKSFLSKNIVLILIIMGGILIYISNHYTVDLKLNEIDDLKQELEDKKYEAISANSKLMKVSRQSTIHRLVNEKGLQLEDPKTPPFVIKLDKKGQ
jgi:cell division protein FtsL